MKGAAESNERFTRYLLGDLPEEERVRLEEEYFTDDDVFESLLAARDELVDLHARGELKGGVRERFEKHFLSTEARRLRARGARELVEFTTRIAAAQAADEGARGESRRASLPRAPALGFAFAALLICAALGGAWLILKRAGTREAERAAVTSPPTPETVSQPRPSAEAHPRPEGERADAGVKTPARPAESSAPRRAQTPDANSNRTQARPAAPAQGAAGVASILLTPVLTRDAAGPANTLLIRPGTGAARLQLSFRGGGYRRYTVILRTIDGEQVWRGAASKARAPGAGQTAVVNVPARVFRRQDHTATLYGVAADGKLHELGEYFFTVRRDESQ